MPEQGRPWQQGMGGINIYKETQMKIYGWTRIKNRTPESLVRCSTTEPSRLISTILLARTTTLTGLEQFMVVQLFTPHLHTLPAPLANQGIKFILHIFFSTYKSNIHKGLLKLNILLLPTHVYRGKRDAKFVVLW